MEIKSIRIREVSVKKFSAKTCVVTLLLKYEDTSIEFETKIDYPVEIAEQLIKKVRTTVKRELLTKKKFFGPVIHLVIMDEDAVVKKISKYLTKVKKEVELFALQKVASGYLQRVARITNMKVSL